MKVVATQPDPVFRKKVSKTGWSTCFFL